ncbi:DUF2911 domain-containing protein [Aureibaculum sp. 2210JD6-5]|uniref:DUF2911 domain-containing protein n=1 Tax=Aureibaculum sp. 2210JD6-5 TaxID=3103957 RepID=UPI002AAD895E|nr:DUF2911 domain-containing protein [Aureibaculum sp. 2210JD6-5]MDY7396645.1 DUF2911 domain-containing protein [Aureibaculum sp. 2210JD6-5]
MNYKKLLIVFLCLGTMSITAQIKTPAPSPYSKVMQTVGLTDVEVEYSRPSMKGRKIFGGLESWDVVWRTGANARTKITFGNDVTIDGDTLKKGTYAIFTKPNPESWEVYFYTEHAGNGAPRNWDDSKVALKTSVKPFPIPMPIETFTISFDDLTDDSAVLGMMWEKTYIGVKFNVPTDAIAAKSIENVMSGPSANDYHSAASYYRNSGKDLKQALVWSTKATEMNKNAFWMMREKSLIHAALGDKKGAIEAAKKSLEVAEREGNDNYIKMNKESIAEWSK